MAHKHRFRVPTRLIHSWRWGAVAWLAMLSAAAGAASSPCTPDAPYTQCLRFTAEGANQAFVVPADVSTIHVRLWGAGGGGIDSAYWQPPYGGAGGGFTRGTVQVTPGESLNLTVGAGGLAGSYAGGTRGTAVTFGGGGSGGLGIEANGSSGGGMSALWRGAAFTVGNQLLIAGGGGGASNGSEGEGATGFFGVAGGGGGLSGGEASADLNTNGAGGTQSAGGAAATDLTSFCSVYPTAGAQFQGGAGADNTVSAGWGEGGGGGGGGWFGGGGGRCQPGDGLAANGGGGGGSGFIAGAGVSAAATTAGTNASTASTGGLAANSGDTQYVAGIGLGGADVAVGTGDGGHGLIVIQWGMLPTAPVAIPVDGAWMLALLSLSLGLGAAWRQRRRG